MTTSTTIGNDSREEVTESLVTRVDDASPHDETDETTEMAPRRRIPVRRVLRLIALVLVVLLAGAAVVISFTGLPERDTVSIELLTGTVTRGTARTEVSGSGVVSPAVTTDLAFAASSGSSGSSGGAASGSSSGAASSATVSSIKVKVGQRVKRGQVLATLDTAALRLSASAAQQTYDAAVAARDSPTTTTQNGSTTQEQTDEALDLAVAEAAVDLSSAKDAVAAATIQAPHAGIVDSLSITRGSVPPSDTAAIVLRGAGMRVTIDVAEDDVPSVKVGQKAAVHLVALDEDVTGTVTAIDAEDAADSAAGAGAGAGASSSSLVTFPVDIVLASVPAGLRAGMSATVTITTAEHEDALLVPVTAVVGTGDDAMVRVPDGDGSFTTQSVQVGLTTSTYAEITSGLDVGDAVVTGVVRTDTSEDDEAAGSQGSLGGIGGGGGFGGPPGGGMGGPPPGMMGGGAGVGGGATRGGGARG